MASAGNPGLFRFSIFVAACTLAVVALGALVTNRLAATPPVNYADLAALHRTAGDALAVLLLMQAAWMFRAPSLRVWAGVSLVVMLAAVGLGHAALAGEPAATQSAISFFHAVMAQILFAVEAAIATITAPSWQRPPIEIPDKGWPSLRGFSRLTAVLVALQVMLGAAFRHNLMGVLWHIIGALILALFILGLAMLIMNQPPESVPNGNPLRVPAIVLLSVAGLQLLLGLTVVSMNADSRHALAVAVLTVAHAINGALTFAATMILAVMARRHTRRVA